MHCNTVNYNWPRQMTRVWVLLILSIRLHVFKRDLISYILEPLNNATPCHVFSAFQTKTRLFENRILEIEIKFLNCLQNGYTSVETTVSKSLPPLFLLYFKKHPTF